METKRPLPFDCRPYSKSEEVTNPYSGETCTLEPDALAVYDVIKGAEITGNHKLVRKGLDWFRKYFPSEYYTLLD